MAAALEYPLTEAQSGLWFAQRLDPANPIFNTAHYLDIRGDLDVEAFHAAVDQMADVLREQTRRGVPILFSSHQLDLVDRLSDSLVILAKGRVVAAGTPGGLRAGAAVRHRLVLSGDAGWTRDLPGIHVADVEGSSAVVEILTPGAERDLLAQALSRGTVHAYAPIVPPLSEIYREVTA